ncbi:hypothetical protein M9H77_03295 [Catharanthus roseus]|uniref:Uncharacterized protein n=1 Tax=Catharanthus roseus TaxID=4058 RepID=A0ACC0CB03_CATRO|nr:hypothetical protein M9H77_03295 [Catharanthus roseus]
MNLFKSGMDDVDRKSQAPIKSKLRPITRARTKKLKDSNGNEDNGVQSSFKEETSGRKLSKVGEGHPTTNVPLLLPLPVGFWAKGLKRSCPTTDSRSHPTVRLVSYWSVEFKIVNRGSSRKGGHPWEGVESKLQSKVDLRQSGLARKFQRVARDVEELKRGKSSATKEQRVGDNFGGVNSPHHQRPYNNMPTQGYHDMSVCNPYPFYEAGRKGGQCGRGYYRPHEEVPRYEAWGEDNLFDDFGEDPNVDKHTMVATMVPSFKGESDPNVFLEWGRQVENLFMARNNSDIVKVKLVIAEFLGYAFQ